MEDVKARLEAAVLAPMRNPELVRLYGKSLSGGLLLTAHRAAGRRSSPAQPSPALLRQRRPRFVASRTPEVDRCFF
jgi:hypothetical protein